MQKCRLRWFGALVLLAIVGLAGLWICGQVIAPSNPGQAGFRDQSLLHRLLPGLARAHDLRALNKGNIRFFGRLVDQFGQPVTNAAILCNIEYFQRFNAWPVFKIVTNRSDVNGCFSILGHEGFFLRVTPKRSGYALTSTNTAFSFSPMRPPMHRPDPDTPVVLRLWKCQGAEPLLEIEQRYRIAFTNVPVHVDLLSALSCTEGGDLSFTIIRPDGLVDQRNQQAWGVVIRGVDGGIMETAEYATTLEAPQVGYEPEMAREFTVSSGSWSDRWTAQLFFRSRAGRIHGKVVMSLYINESPDQPVRIDIKGVANTNSSRNWEASAPKELLP